MTVTAVEGRSHPANRRVYQRNTQLPFLIERWADEDNLERQRVLAQPVDRLVDRRDLLA